jgi:hypothetical protein
VLVANSEGNVEAWDLNGKNSSIEPAVSVQASSNPLTSLDFARKTIKGAQHVAVSDAAGTLRIMEMPRSLSKPIPNEKALVEATLERELERVAYVRQRQAIREMELTAKTAADEAAKAAAAPLAGPAAPDEEEHDPEAAAAAAAAKEKEAMFAALEAAFHAAEFTFKETLRMVIKGEGGEDL